MAACMDCVTGSCGARLAPPKALKQQRVELDVGGRRFTSSRHTLSQSPSSLLATLISGEPQEDGSYFIDRDPDFFGFVLSFLRDGAEHFVPPDDARNCAGLRREAKQLGIEQLAILLDRKLAEQAEKGEPQAPIASLCPYRPEPPAYVGAPIPNNETQRIATLNGLGVLYTSREHHYDCIVDVIAALLDMPIVLVSLVSTDEQWFKARCGLDCSTTSRSSSFCAFTFKPENPKMASMLVIEDARRDPRVADNPLVIGEPYIQFYAGCPLVTSCGIRLGALCCIDRVPRSFNFAQAQILINFGQLTTQYLEASHLIDDDIDIGGSSGGGLPQELSNGSLDFAAGALREQRMRDGLKEMVLLVWARPDSDDWPMLYANLAWTMATGLAVKSPKKFPGEIEIINLQSDSSAVPGASLWSHMRCSSHKDSTKLSSFCGLPRALLSQQPHSVDGARIQAPTFSLSTTIRRSTGEETNVLCRFSPADKPLDEAASTTCAAQQASTNKAPLSPYGFPPGVLYFVVIVEQRAGATDFVRADTQESVPTVSSDVPDPVCKRLELTSLRRSISERDGPETTRADVASNDSRLGGGVGPPRFPYDDIHILRLVGEGSFGKVYRGLWNGMSVAVKVISIASSMRQRLTLSPDIEAELSSLVSHPNLVTTYQYGVKHASSNRMEASLAKSLAGDPGGMEMWIVQEWCDGGTLGDYCKVPKLDGAGILEACDIALEIGQGIAYLHDRCIIHGDLIPSNVMLTSQPTKRGYTYKVCDFGRARICDNEQQTIMTQTMGTVTHMPPELFVANIDLAMLSPKADVYALGVIMYQVVTAKLPFAGLSPPQVIVRVAGGTSLTLPDEVPQSLKRVYIRCVSREPKDRPDAKHLIKEIEKVKQELRAQIF